MSVAPLILAPTNAGIPSKPGVRRGPDRIAAHLAVLADQSERAAWNVYRLTLAYDAVANVRTIAEAVAERVVASQVPLIAGGDHTIAAGSVLGVRRGLRRRHGCEVPLYVLWLDAHADANTPETSPSGNVHGMVLAGLLGVGPLALDEPLPAERVVLAGARDLDPGERAFLADRSSLRRWDVAALQGEGWRPLLDQLLAEIARAGGRLYISLDLDVVDPSFAPGVAVPTPGGARPEAVLALLRDAQASGLLAGADVVEFDPSADVDGRTAAIAARALLALAGRPRPTGEAAGSTPDGSNPIDQRAHPVTAPA